MGSLCGSWASLVAQRLKRLPLMRETQVRSLGQEDPLEKGRLPTPVFLPGESHAQRSLAGYSPWGRKESGMSMSDVDSSGTCLAGACECHMN